MRESPTNYRCDCTINNQLFFTNSMPNLTQTPLWLKLKKEYIDDNFDQLVMYLKEHTHKGETDAFYDETVNLLHERVMSLVDQFCQVNLFDEVTTANRDFEIRLLATYLLANNKDKLAKSVYVILMHLLLSHNEKYANKIMENISKCLRTADVESYGFSWSDIINENINTFAYKCIHNVKFSLRPIATHTYTNHGSAILNKDGLVLTYLSASDSKKLDGDKHESLHTEPHISLRTPTSEKLKQSQQNSMQEQFAFVEEFCTRQNKYINVKKRLNTYQLGDDVVVRITDITFDDVIHVETIDPKYNVIKGEIYFPQNSIDYYYVNIFPRALHPGECVRATLHDPASGKFILDKTFIQFIVNDCESNYGVDAIFSARLIDCSHQKSGFFVWLSQDGFPIYTKADPRYSRCDFARLQVDRYQTGKYYGKIDGSIIDDNVEAFDEAGIRYAFVNDFTKWGTDINTTAETEDAQDRPLDKQVLAILVRFMFAYQKTLLDPADRFTMQMCALVMCNMIDDDLNASYLQFASTYLMGLVQFANNNPDFAKVQLTPDERYRDAEQTVIRLKIVELLKLYGKSQTATELEQAITQYQDTAPLIAKLAQLIQTANVMQGVLSDAAISMIKREIIRALAIETENNSNLNNESGEYLGVESGTQEFKESIIYPPSNQMQAAPTKQCRNVMKGLCAFLNSESGGTLYIGVSDLGYITGIANDMKYLNCTGIDTYMRYIQDQAVIYFGKEIAAFLHIEPRFGKYDYIAIRVESYPYDIVRMAGEGDGRSVAYIRINAESREMPDSMCNNLIARKINRNKNANGFVAQLSKSCHERKQIILQQYNMIETHKVEVYDLQVGNDLFTAFDVDTHKPSLFRVTRIGYVEETNQPWMFSSLHRKLDIDDFNQTGSKPINVNLLLDVTAVNTLLDNFPKCKAHIEKDKNQEIWYYTATVYNIETVGRFYLSMIGHINHSDSPELKRYVEEAIRQL